MTAWSERRFGEITLRGSDGSEAVVAPLRGGMLVSWSPTLPRRASGSPGCVERLFLDPASYAEHGKNVRGGNPVLFPAPGKLANDAVVLGGVKREMKQHGFARALPWEVATATESSAVLRLGASDATRASYPFEFLVELTYRFEGSLLRVETRIENRGDVPLPFGFGFHPYFHVPQQDKATATISTRATRAFDNVTKRAQDFAGFHLDAPETDLHLLDHGAPESTLRWGDQGDAVTVRASPEYTHWVVWSVKDRDFVCLEPWTCPGDALNTGDRASALAPGTQATLWISLESP